MGGTRTHRPDNEAGEISEKKIDFNGIPWFGRMLQLENQTSAVKERKLCWGGKIEGGTFKLG